MHLIYHVRLGQISIFTKGTSGYNFLQTLTIRTQSKFIINCVTLHYLYKLLKMLAKSIFFMKILT